MKQLLEALDLAQEALEYFSDTSPTMAGKAHAEDAITAIKQARSAPVQEPAIKQGWDVDTLLDKPAAQRQWVNLTDEEIDKTPCELYAPDQGGMTMEEGLQVYARAIEAKLRSKNNG